MERGCNGNGGGGVKVTFIETRFVTSDAAGFKSLVQRLTGNDATIASGTTAPPPAPWVDETMMLYETCDLAEMLCVDVGASGGGCYGGGYGGGRR